MKKFLLLISMSIIMLGCASSVNKKGHRKGRKHHSGSFSDNTPIINNHY